MGGPQDAGVRYAPALDGLRALAVLAVLAYHGGVRWMPGGFLGVDVFLVLSGYLITALLVEEWRAAGAIRLGRFWGRRVRRLVPALAVVVAAVVAHAAVTGAVAEVRGDAVATLGWVQNWYLAASDASYFAVFGDASPLRHAWSLALEAQWYLVWPPLLVLGLRVTRGRTLPLAAGALALAAASALLMAGWFDPAADPSRVYYGTDTRGHVLLIGAALALVLHRAPATALGGKRSGIAWSLVGVAGAAVVGLAMHRLADLDPRLYRGGFALVGVATVAVVVAARRADLPVARLLQVPPLPALGRISYGVYLWHWPLFLWMGPGLDATALAMAAAAASYHLVELPVRRASGVSRRPAAVLSLAGAAAVAALALALPAPPEPEPAPALALGGPERPRAVTLPESQPASLAAPSDPTIAPAPVPQPGVSRILMAGDSVAWTLGEEFDPAWVGGRVIVDYGATYLGCGVTAGQPYNDGRPVLWADPACLTWEDRWRQRVEQVDPDVVVVLLGAWEVLDRKVDGTLLKAGTDEYERYLRGQLDRAFDLLTDAGVRVVALTAPCYRPEGEMPGRSTSDRGDDRRVDWFNEVLRNQVAARGDGVTVADLHGRLCPRGEYLTEWKGDPVRTDGVHVTLAGARYAWDWLLPQISAD